MDVDSASDISEAPSQPGKKGQRGNRAWKPARMQSFETITLTTTVKNPVIRPCGFRTDGVRRMVKETCLISRMRQLAILKGQNPRLAVCITMYNEEEKELQDTLTGVIQNYNAMYMDPDLKLRQQEMVVVLVCDGFDAIKQSFKNFAKKHKLFDERLLQQNGFMHQDNKGTWKMKTMRQLMTKEVKDEDVPKNCLHLFQVCTWDFGCERNYLSGRRINFIFALKQRNDGKINSHKWFFQGICKYLKPDFTLMLDVGTRATDNAILKLFKYMSVNKTCGGCCGEIEVDLQNCKSQSAFLVCAAQYYEYKLSHSPDKACESFFGFNSVLPGAYCLFRWQAIQKGPMDAFFKLANSKKEPTCAEANEYLAEDRVMCLQIYIKIACQYYLTYIPDAKAVTDAPDSILVLIKQRRRWMNGALFAAWRVLFNMGRMAGITGETAHPVYRRFTMILFMIFYFVNQLFQLLIVGQFFITIKIFFEHQFAQFAGVFDSKDGDWWVSFFDGTGSGLTFGTVFSFTYVIIVLWCIVISLAMPLDRAMTYFRLITAVFSALTLISMAGIIYTLQQTGFFPMEMKNVCHEHSCEWKPVDPIKYNFSYITMAGVVMALVFVLPMILRPIDFLNNFQGYIVGMLTYIFILPLFINIMQIYAMCNLHDISWGNRPAVSDGGTNAFAESAKKQMELNKQYKMFRVNKLCMWGVFNALYIVIIGEFSKTPPADPKHPVHKNDGVIRPLDGFALFLAGIVLYKVFFAVIHLLYFKIRISCYEDLKVHTVDLKEEVKKLAGGNVANSDMDMVALEEELLRHEQQEEDQDDHMLTTSIRPDVKLIKELRKRQKEEQKKDHDLSELDRTAYHSDDDDEEEFEKADKEETNDTFYAGQSAFMVSNRDNAGRKKLKKKGSHKKDNGYMPPIDNNPRYSRDTEKSVILRRDTMTSEFYTGVLPYLQKEKSNPNDRSFASRSILATKSQLESIIDTEEIQSSQASKAEASQRRAPPSRTKEKQFSKTIEPRSPHTPTGVSSPQPAVAPSPSTASAAAVASNPMKKSPSTPPPAATDLTVMYKGQADETIMYQSVDKIGEADDEEEDQADNAPAQFGAKKSDTVERSSDLFSQAFNNQKKH